MRGVKIAFLILIGLFLSLIATQMYFYFKYDGNLVFFISNQSEEIEEISLEVRLDDKTLIIDKFSNRIYFPEPHSFKVHPGYHQLEITGKSHEFKLINGFNLIGVKWIVIDVFSKVDSTEDTYPYLVIDHQLIPPVFQ